LVVKLDAKEPTMRVPAYVLAAALVLPAFNAGADEVQSAGHQNNAGSPASGVVAGPGVEAQGGATDAVGGESSKRAGDQLDPASQRGGVTESAAGHQPAVKPLPGDHGREEIWDSPIDTSITVHQGRTPNKGPKGIGVAVRAIAQGLLNKSKSAIAPGVVIRHDAHNDHEKPMQAPSRLYFRAGISFPARNAIGASIEPRTATDYNAPLRVSHSAQQSLFLQGTGKTALGAQGAPIPAMAARPVATDHNPAAQQVIGSAVAAHGLVAMSAGGPALSGTAMIRPGSGAGAIGGPPKAVTGVISGANIRMRHP
jgi:hypothetical protein